MEGDGGSSSLRASPKMEGDSRSSSLRASPKMEGDCRSSSRSSSLRASPKMKGDVRSSSSIEEIIVSVEDNIGHSWANSVSEQMDTLVCLEKEPCEFTICRVPEPMRKGKEKYYEPSMVSIGPYHRGRDHLQPMEDYKLRFLKDFLDRNTKNSLQVYIDALRDDEETARGTYFNDIHLTSEEFVKMLLIDGCFVIEFFLKAKISGGSNIVGGTGWLHVCIKNDLLLLENQIPFVVISTLFDILVTDIEASEYEKSIYDLGIVQIMASIFGQRSDQFHLYVQDEYHVLMIAWFIIAQRQKDDGLAKKNDTADGRTFLGLVLKTSREEYENEDESNPKSSSSSSPSSPFVKLGVVLTNLLKPLKLALLYVYSTLSWKNKETSSTIATTIPSASKLDEYGLKIKRRTGEGSLTEIKYKDGVLEIPSLHISEELKCLLFNILAYEQCCISDLEALVLSTYFQFMDFLVDTPKDVEILQECGVIVSYLESAEETALLFNQLNHHAVVDRVNHYLVPVYKEIDKFCTSKWHRYRAKLKRDYFSNPWSIISLIAAVILLILTLVQTYFAWYGYVYPSS